MGWAEEAASSRDSLAADGVAVVLVKRTGGAYDPVQGTVEQTEQQYNCFAVLDAPETQEYGAQLQDGTSVTSDDKVAYLDAVSARPVPGDTMRIMGEDWTVKHVQTTEPGGVPVLHRCIIRGA